jgi:hypothetical protein
MNGTVAARPPTVTLEEATGTAGGEEGAPAPSATGGIVAPRPVKNTMATAPGAIGLAAVFSEVLVFSMAEIPGDAGTTLNGKPADAVPLLVTTIVAVPTTAAS